MMTTVESITVDNNLPENIKKSDVSNENISLVENASDVSVSHSDEERRNSAENGNSDLQEIPRKRKRRRIKGGGRHHKKWKPYDKLTWPEKKALEDKETIRATQKREEAFASGHPVAPYNTTQFLMEDHIQSEASPDLLDVDNAENMNVAHRDSYNSDGSSDCEFGVDDDETFLAKEFSEAYDNIHAERLQTMSKEQLVKDFVELERKVETLEKKLKDSNQNNRHRERDQDNSDGTSLSSSGEEILDLAALKNAGEEMKKLREDNMKMKQQIEDMKNKNGSC